MEHIQISHQFSVCVWIYPKWIRWFPLIEVFHVKISAPAWENERLISCFLKDKNRKGILDVRVEFVNIKNSEFRDIRVFKTNNSFAIHKILRFPVDFIFGFCIKMKPSEGGTDSASLLTLMRMRPRCLSMAKFQL